MARHAYLADLFRHGGLTVIEYPGWRTRGSDRFDPQGDVQHVTVTPPTLSDQRAADLLANGRPDLPGPLAQRGTARDGTVWVIAAGRCNHNGYGYMGNDAFGNEMFNDGYTEPITPAQLDSAQRQAALIAEYNRFPIDRVLGHKETDPKRKIDPRSIWMPGFRAAVLDLMNGDDMSQADIEQIKQMLTSIKQDTKTTTDEMFHGAEQGEPVPETGQRKTQWWNILVNSKKVPATLSAHSTYLASINTQLSEQGEVLKAILAAVTPPPVDPGE